MHFLWKYLYTGILLFYLLTTFEPSIIIQIGTTFTKIITLNTHYSHDYLLSVYVISHTETILMQMKFMQNMI